MIKRLRHDFQLSIITLMGVIGVLGITPYAVYRLSQGNLMVGIADCVIVLSTVAAVAYAWYKDDTERAGLCLCGIFSLCATLIAINLGVNGLFWIYPLILFNFFMVTPGKAISATLLVLACLVGYSYLVPGSVFDSRYQMLSFVVTNFVAGLLTFIFALRTRTQRDRLQQLATQDPLTGAGNRRAMNEELRIAVSTRYRHGHSFGVLVMDLDHFKQINDRFGHQAGDQVLIDFVELVRSSSRQGDRLFRFGGEEFLLLLPDTDNQGLQAAANHLLARVRQFLQGPGGVVSVSIGGALLNANESWSHWLQRADNSLYQAKREGRDCCIIDQTPSAASQP